MSNDLIFLGNIIKDRRAEMGLTPDMLGDKVFCTSRWIYQIENGKCRPSMQLMKLIFEVLEMTDRFEDVRAIIEKHKIE